jgi:hypothetical protein
MNGEVPVMMDIINNQKLCCIDDEDGSLMERGEGERRSAACVYVKKRGAPRHKNLHNDPFCECNVNSLRMPLSSKHMTCSILYIEDPREI